MKLHLDAVAPLRLLLLLCLAVSLAGCAGTEDDTAANINAATRVGLSGTPHTSPGNPAIRSVASINLEMQEFLLGTNILQDKLKGLGVVYGLAGTGSVPRDLVHANQMREQLKQLHEGGLVPELVTFEDFETGACALVTVTANYPVQRGVGTRFDITITNDAGAVSLKHGRLFPVHLRDETRPNDDTTWALTDQDISKRQPLPVLGEDGLPIADVPPTSWRVPGAAYLVRELPRDRNSNQTLLLSLGEYNRDLFEAMRGAMRQRYPFEVVQQSGGLGRGRVEVQMTPGFSRTAEQVLDDLGAMEFPVGNTRVPLVIFDNRSGAIVFVNGTVRLRQRWLATAHVPDPGSEFYESARHKGEPGDPAHPVFSWGPITDTGGNGMVAVPYIVASPDESVEDIKKVLEDKGTAAKDRRGTLIGDASGLRVITWRGNPQNKPEEVQIAIEHNDLRDILTVLRDRLHLPGPELKQFVLDAHRRGYLSDCFVMERFPRMIHSQARDMTWFPDTKQLAIGNVVLRGTVIDGADPGTWDFLPGPVADDAPRAHGFTVADANRIGNLMTTLDGNIFRWRDADGELQSRQVRLSEKTRESLLRARIQLLIDGCEAGGGGIQQALDRLQREMRLIANVDTPPEPEPPPQVKPADLEQPARRVFSSAVDWLNGLSALSLPPSDWKETWPGRPSPANAIVSR